MCVIRLCKQNYVPTTWVIHVHIHTVLRYPWGNKARTLGKEGAGFPSNEPVDVQTMFMSSKWLVVPDWGSAQCNNVTGLFPKADRVTAHRQAVGVNETQTDTKWLRRYMDNVQEDTFCEFFNLNYSVVRPYLDKSLVLINLLQYKLLVCISFELQTANCTDILKFWGLVRRSNSLPSFK